MEGEKYLFSVPYINQEFHRSLWKRTRSLLKYLPRQRYLVHGDYGYDNLVLQGGKISAVLDWGNSAYGDYIHDVAWLDFWDSEIDYGCFMREYYDHTGKKVLHYDERLRLHKLAIASESLGFYAYSGQADTYRKHLEQIKSSDLMA